eukprot:14367649-Heterocapsa_arctica.AAC.1
MRYNYVKCLLHLEAEGTCKPGQRRQTCMWASARSGSWTACHRPSARQQPSDPKPETSPGFAS